MYAPSSIIAQSFSALFLKRMNVPSYCDALMVLRSQLDICKYPPILCNFLVMLFTHLEMMEEKLLALAKLSVPSSYFSCQHIINPSLPLKFFELVTEAVNITHDGSQIENYFSELAMYIVIFNKVPETRVKEVIDLIAKVNQFVKNYDMNYLHLNDTKVCNCDEYSASGDCYCIESLV